MTDVKALAAQLRDLALDHVGIHREPTADEIALVLRDDARWRAATALTTLSAELDAALGRDRWRREELEARIAELNAYKGNALYEACADELRRLLWKERGE